MMKITKRMISLLLCIVLLFGQIPAEGMASSFAAARAAAGPLPEMDERLCVLEQEVSAEAAAAIAGEVYESGDYRAYQKDGKNEKNQHCHSRNAVL